MKKILYIINYVDTPLIREKGDEHLILESQPAKVWNPVFTVGVIAFVTSMLIRGFLNAYLAVIPLGLSTLVLFSGVWILSANGMVVFDRKESKCYLIYRHLGYLQKIYSHPLTSFDKVLIDQNDTSTDILQLLKDDGTMIRIAKSKLKESLMAIADEIATFIRIPLSHD